MFIWRNPKFQEFASQLFSGINQGQQQQPPQQPPQEEEVVEEQQPQGTVTGNKIYPDASPPHECTNVSDGEKEQGGDRREPQIACGFDFLNTEGTVYFRTSGTINDTLSVKLRGPKHSSPTPESDMCNIIHYIALGSNSSEPFGKQAGHTAEYCEFGGSSVKAPDGTWVGVKAIEWNEGSGVHFLTYLDNPEGSGWKLAADTVDNGDQGCGGLLNHTQSLPVKVYPTLFL